MSDKFEKYIKDRFENFEADVPENAWTNISSAIKGNATGNSGGSSWVTKTLKYVAVGLAIAGLGYFLMIDDTQNPKESRTENKTIEKGISTDDIESEANPENTDVSETIANTAEFNDEKEGDSNIIVIKTKESNPNSELNNISEKKNTSEGRNLIPLQKNKMELKDIPVLVSSHSTDKKGLARPADYNDLENAEFPTVENNDLPMAQIIPSVVSGYAPLEVVFTNKEDVLRQYWDLGNGKSTFGRSAKTIYHNPGTYLIRLNTVDDNGNEASDIFELEVKEASNLYIPNSFSPNGDGINDEFRAEGSNLNDFNLAIYSKTGDLIFHTRNIKEPWDGKSGITGAGADYYIAIVKAAGFDGEIYDERIVVRIIQ